MASKGILGRKLGMTQVWDAENRIVPVTVLQAGPCRVVQLKTPERDGYAAVQLAFGDTKPARLNKPELGHLTAADVPPAKHLAELPVDDLAGFEVGQLLAADVFQTGDRVDVTGISKGKGFTGVMKRHNFHGQGASHGNHKKHRAPGAIGACATPARVFKGMGMPGQHGNARVLHGHAGARGGPPRAGPPPPKGTGPRPRRQRRVRARRREGRRRPRGGEPMNVDVTTVGGGKAGSVDLPDEMFGITPNRS